MCDGRASPRVLALVGPGPHPAGCREVAARRAARHGVALGWEELPDERALASRLGAVGAGTAVLLASGALASSSEVARATTAVPGRVVHVAAGAQPRDAPVPAACERTMHGRGRRGFAGAIDHFATTARSPATTVAYGHEADQVGELRLPAEHPGRAPLAVLVHGGFWSDHWERDTLDLLAAALPGRGWASWNVEYRRMGPSGGGWPGTLEDVCLAVDAAVDLARDHPVDPRRMVLLGHSVGAQLAIYAAVRDRLPAGAPGRPPRARPAAIAALAGVLDLDAAARDGLGDGAAHALLGRGGTAIERTALASPSRLVPVGVPLLALHGRGDRLVPVGQSRAFADAARAAGDEVELVVTDADHFAIVDPDGPAAGALWRWLDARRDATGPTVG